MKINSNKVLKFSGLGEVIKILLYPCAIAAETANPKAADFHLPRAAVRVTVLRNVFSAIASTKVVTALA